MKGEYISIETTKIMADIEKENKLLQEENIRLKEEYIMLQNASDEIENKLHDRIDKAIEYIKEQTVDVEMNIYGMPPTIKSFRGNTERLLEILKGEK